MNDNIQQADERRNPLTDAGDPLAMHPVIADLAPNAYLDGTVDPLGLDDIEAAACQEQDDSDFPQSPGSLSRRLESEDRSKPSHGPATITNDPRTIPTVLLVEQADPYASPPPTESDLDGRDDEFYADEDGESELESSIDCQNLAKERAQSVTVPRLMLELRKENYGGVWVPRLARRITDNGDQAICLSQLLYWFDKSKKGTRRARCFKNGRYWVYKTHEEFGEETGLSAARVKVCLKALKDKNFITIDHFLANGLRTTHMSINVQEVFLAMNKAAFSGKRQVSTI